KELHLGPVHLVLERSLRQDLEQTSGGRAAGKRHGEPAARRDRFAGQADEFFRGRTADLFGISYLSKKGTAHGLGSHTGADLPGLARSASKVVDLPRWRFGLVPR